MILQTLYCWENIGDYIGEWERESRMNEAHFTLFIVVSLSMTLGTSLLSILLISFHEQCLTNCYNRKEWPSQRRHEGWVFNATHCNNSYVQMVLNTCLGIQYMHMFNTIPRTWFYFLSHFIFLLLVTMQPGFVIVSGSRALVNQLLNYMNLCGEIHV